MIIDAVCPVMMLPHCDALIEQRIEAGSILRGQAASIVLPAKKVSVCPAIQFSLQGVNFDRYTLKSTTALHSHVVDQTEYLKQRDNICAYHTEAP